MAETSRNRRVPWDVWKDANLGLEYGNEIFVRPRGGRGGGLLVTTTCKAHYARGGHDLGVAGGVLVAKQWRSWSNHDMACLQESMISAQIFGTTPIQTNSGAKELTFQTALPSIWPRSGGTMSVPSRLSMVGDRWEGMPGQGEREKVE